MYVWIASGEEEEFLDSQELSKRLEDLLNMFPQGKMPSDLARFEDSKEAVAYLIDSACELAMPGTLGTYQWFSVRLEG